MKTIRTAATRQRFLDALAECGNVRAACRALGLTRGVMYQWRAADPEFADAWDSTLGMATVVLEDEAQRRALNGSDKLLMFLLRHLRPEVYGQRATIEVRCPCQAGYRDIPLAEMRRRLDELRSRQDGGMGTSTEANIAPPTVPTTLGMSWRR